jgi:hypothetical protein
MERTRTRRPSPAMAVALLALFVAIGGTGYAALKLPKGSVGARQLKKNAVRSAKVKDRSLQARDFKRGQLPSGPRGATGPAGRSALTTLRRGETIRGTWNIDGDQANGSAHTAAVTFQLPASRPVDSAHVALDGNDEPPGSGCSGTAAAPVAGPGFVCAYVASSAHTTSGSGFGALRVFPTASGATGDGSRYGFVIDVAGTAAFRISGTWAYTAP